VQNLWQTFIRTTTLAVFLASATWAAVLAVSVPPGESGGGYVILGDNSDDADYVSIEIAPLGVRGLVLDRGTNAKADDFMVIKTNVDWKLTVEDTSGGFANTTGFMEPYVSGAYVDEVGDELANRFAVLVVGVDDNDGLLTNATDLSLGPVEIVQGNSTGDLEKTVYLRYSQNVSGKEVTGDYGINLTYNLSINK